MSRPKELPPISGFPQLWQLTHTTNGYFRAGKHDWSKLIPTLEERSHQTPLSLAPPPTTGPAFISSRMPPPVRRWSSSSISDLLRTLGLIPSSRTLDQVS